MKSQTSDPAPIDSQMASDSITDELNRILQGDASAQGQYDALFQRMRPQLIQIARRAIEQRLQSKLSASDIVQETLCEAAKNLPEFRGTTVAMFNSWLQKILQNNVQDARRKFVDAQKRRVDREQTFDSAFVAVGRRSDQTPSKIAGKREFDVEMQRAIADLTSIDQQILQLRFQRALTFTAIGEMVNMKSDTVRQRLPGILKKLQSQLRQFDSRETPAKPRNA